MLIGKIHLVTALTDGQRVYPDADHSYQLQSEDDPSLNTTVEYVERREDRLIARKHNGQDYAVSGLGRYELKTIRNWLRRLPGSISRKSPTFPMCGRFLVGWRLYPKVQSDATGAHRWRLWGANEIFQIPVIYFQGRLDVLPKAWELCRHTRRKPQLPHGVPPMTIHDRKTDEKILRDAFRSMDPHQAQEIREAYYKAVEGLHTLVELLEIADANQDKPAGPLLSEHLMACVAMDAMKDSLLGKIV